MNSIFRRELPGLKGFSASSIKDMRAFYEYWSQYINRQPLAVDLQITENKNEEIAYRVILRKLTQRVNNFYNRFPRDTRMYNNIKKNV